MLYLVIGNKGYGKSCFITREMYYLTKRGYDVYANFRLRLPGAHILNLNQDSIKGMYKKSKIGIAIDEGTMYFDSRRSMSKENRQISYILEQSRKRGTEIYIATQRMREIDLRARFNFDKLIYVYPYCLEGKFLKRANIEEVYKEKVSYVKVKEYVFGSTLLRRYFFYARPYFKLYDTHEMFPIMY